MERFESLVNAARRMTSEGKDLEETVHDLRHAGATITECVKVVRLIEGVSLGRAKDLVDSSTTWADRFDPNDSVRQDAITALEDNDPEDRGPMPRH